MKRETMRTISHTALFAALIAVCTWVAVPSAVPFTLQTLGVCLAVGLGGRKCAVLAVLTYIALGAVGLPVFSGFRGGIGVLFGNTGGYIFGFLPAAFFGGWLLSRLQSRKGALVLSFAAVVAVCYLFGSLWYFLLYTHTTGAAGFGAILLQCVLPFLPADILKIALAVLVTRRLKGMLWTF